MELLENIKKRQPPGWELQPFNEFGEIPYKKAFLLVADSGVLAGRRAEGRGGFHVDAVLFRLADVLRYEAAHPELFESLTPPKGKEPDRVGKAIIAYRIALERGAVDRTPTEVKEEIAEAIGADAKKQDRQIREYVVEGREYVDYLLNLRSKSGGKPT